MITGLLGLLLVTDKNIYTTINQFWKTGYLPDKEVKQARAFVPDKPFQPRLTFASKAIA
jgi:hypothetical protein